ncbi:MAG TPA: fumarylacetoacetate hydrolase family protein [Candidatus Dormibacteraeota bacterium]|nr:fumarylacetoacetate hydrolase family protein [Candidatus Dormibacteraeota bacterium]
MKLVTYRVGGGTPRPGAVVDDSIVDLSADVRTLLELIEGGAAALELARRTVAARASVVALGAAELLAPIPEPRRNVFCVGWNYLKHYKEGVGKRGSQEEQLPDHPSLFTKATMSVIGPGADIPFDASISPLLDYEAELGVIIGRRARSIRAEHALDAIFGYTVGNDVSVRDIQRRHGGQWLKGKSFDGTCPIGPWIVTADEIPDPQDLRVQCRVNGVLKQDDTTGNMIFPVRKIIEELSLGMTLLPGDIVLTGTPDGVGFARTPPEYLKPGDEVVVTIEGVGELSNRVAARALSEETPSMAVGEPA